MEDARDERHEEVENITLEVLHALRDIRQDISRLANVVAATNRRTSRIELIQGQMLELLKK
jgi:hypothetical protein